MSQQVKNVEKIEDQGFLDKMQECGQRSEYHNLVDILFVLDATGSMSWCISQMKKTVCKIMKKFADKQYNIKFAIELYRDHPPQEYSYLEKHFDLRNMDEIIKVIDKQCDVAGGGDTPQAVFDGLVNGLKKTSWRISSDGKTKSKRFLYHGCDAPPHGKQYGSISSDKNWQKNGCPCGFTRHDVKKLLDEFSVDYSLIKCGNEADVMAGLFKQCFGERFKRQLEIKNQARSYGRRGGKRQRKTSACYMEQIQKEERLGSDCEQGSGYQSGEAGSAYQERQACYEKEAIQKCSDFDDKIGKVENPKKKQSSSILSKIKRLFSSEENQSKMKESVSKMAPPPPPAKIPKKKKVKKEKADKKQKMKQQQNVQKYSDNSSDEGKEGKPRSMASLVLSDIEDGIDRYFDEPEKKQKKVTKDI